MPQAARAEADKNYLAFKAALPRILSSHSGKFALLHEEEIVDYFDSSLAATIHGAREFGPNRFSVQEVTAEPEHLGFYSYVGGAGNY